MSQLYRCITARSFKQRFAESRLSLLVMLSAVMLGSGCTTITRGTKDVLVVESDPSGADVALSNGLRGKTPTSFELPRKNALTVIISKDGYETVTVNVTPKVVGAGGAGMAGNVLVGGLIGVAVDASTGAMKDLKPNPVRVTLIKLTRDEPFPTPAVSLEQSLGELEDLRDKKLITEDEYARRRARLTDG